MKHLGHLTIVVVVLALAILNKSNVVLAKSLSDSNDWNDYENYSVSDWGPVADGLSIRVTAPQELWYGVPITLLVERRIYADQLRKGTTWWTSHPDKVKFQLDIYDSEDCPGECTWLYSFGKVTSSKRGSPGVDTDKIESTPLTVEFRPDPPRKPPKRKSFFDIPPDVPSFPLTTGIHTYRLKIIVSDSVGVCWHGVAETFFRVRVYPRLVVRKRFAFSAPQSLALLDSCYCGFDETKRDSIIVYPIRSNRVYERVRTGYRTYVGAISDTVDFYQFHESGTWMATPPLPSGKTWPGNGQIDFFEATPEAEIRYLGLGGGSTLWSRVYTLTPTQLQTLTDCSRGK